jgi:hypothetical protein
MVATNRKASHQKSLGQKNKGRKNKRPNWVSYFFAPYFFYYSFDGVLFLQRVENVIAQVLNTLVVSHSFERQFIPAATKNLSGDKQVYDPARARLFATLSFALIVSTRACRARTRRLQGRTGCLLRQHGRVLQSPYHPFPESYFHSPWSVNAAQ